MFIRNLRSGQSGSASANATFARKQQGVYSRLFLPPASENVGQVLYVVDAESTLAALTTDLAGDNNDLTFTAVTPGTGGHAITVAYVDPSANDAELSVEVNGTDIVVNLATGEAGAITSTAADVLEAVEAAAASLVEVTLAAGSSGVGVVTALAETALSGAEDAPAAAISDGTSWKVLELGDSID